MNNFGILVKPDTYFVSNTNEGCFICNFNDPNYLRLDVKSRIDYVEKWINRHNPTINIVKEYLEKALYFNHE